MISGKEMLQTEVAPTPTTTNKGRRFITATSAWNAMKCKAQLFGR